MARTLICAPPFPVGGNLLAGARTERSRRAYGEEEPAFKPVLATSYAKHGVFALVLAVAGLILGWTLPWAYLLGLPGGSATYGIDLSRTGGNPDAPATLDLFLLWNVLFRSSIGLVVLGLLAALVWAVVLTVAGQLWPESEGPKGLVVPGSLVLLLAASLLVVMGSGRFLGLQVDLIHNRALFGTDEMVFVFIAAYATLSIGVLIGLTAVSGLTAGARAYAKDRKGRAKGADAQFTAFAGRSVRILLLLSFLGFLFVPFFPWIMGSVFLGEPSLFVSTLLLGSMYFLISAIWWLLGVAVLLVAVVYVAVARLARGPAVWAYRLLYLTIGILVAAVLVLVFHLFFAISVARMGGGGATYGYNYVPLLAAIALVILSTLFIIRFRKFAKQRITELRGLAVAAPAPAGHRPPLPPPPRRRIPPPPPP